MADTWTTPVGTGDPWQPGSIGGQSIAGAGSAYGVAGPGASNPGGGVGQSSPYQGLFDIFQTGVLNPMNAQADVQLGRLGLQGGLIGANYDTQSNLLNQQLGIGMKQIGIEEGALGRQKGLLPQMADLQRQLFGVSEQDIAAGKEMANFQAGQAQRGAWSNATARGSTVTSGFRQTLGDIGTMLQQRLAGIGRQEERLKIGEKQFDLTEKEREAQLEDQSKRLGLDKEALTNRIQAALSQLGLNKALSTVDIIQAMDDVQNGRFSSIAGVLGQLAQIDPSLASSSGSHYSGGSGQNLLRDAAAKAGFTGQALDIAVAIGMAESGGNPNATNTAGNSAGTDRGAWQINDYYHKDMFPFDWADPYANARAAFQISNGGKNWGPWTTYNTGAYRKYL